MRLISLFTMVFSIFLANCSSGISNNSTSLVDSLQEIIAEAENICEEPCLADSIIVNSLLQIAGETYLSNPDSALLICEKALSVATEAHLVEEKAICYSRLGFLVRSTGNIRLALEYNYLAVEILEKIVQTKKANGNTTLSDEYKNNRLVMSIPNKKQLIV